MATTSLAVKYRPSKFEDVSEQSLIVEILKNLSEAETLSNRNFLLIGPAGCGKTTLARIMANTLNDNKGEPIEIDAASHSGVDGMREIIKQAQQYPIGTKYKTFIIDECFSGDTKVLTNEGFKAFKDLTHDELIAQYDAGTITFVRPTRWIKKEYNGDGYYFNPGYKAAEVCMTAHHVQPIVNVLDPENVKFREEYIQDLEFEDGDRVETVGVVDSGNESLSPLDEVVLVSMMYASGLGKSVETIEDSISCSIPAVHQILSDEHYLTLCSRLAQAGIKYIDLGDVIQYDLPVKCSSVLNTYFKLDQFNQFGAMDFLSKFAYWSSGCILEDVCTPIRRANAEFLAHWDNPHSSLRYSGYNIANLQFIAGMCLMAGAPVEIDEAKGMIQYALAEMVKPSKRLCHIESDVYCVEVPSHNIIVQASGFAFVTGNCHALSSAAWQSVLKTLEEGPARSVFFFATTNPEKIPATIISRVQTFQLSKISLDGITRRLKTVCDAEIAEGRQLTYTDDALQFLAKLAGGGMRDALTNLDKALAFSSDINIENLSKSLNLPKYDDYFDLLNAYAKKDNTKIAKIINEVYNSGVNFIRWFEGFHSFVMNVTKFIFLKDINATMIPSQYLDKISTYSAPHSVVCLKLANKLLTLISALKSTQYLQEVALTYLCSIPTGGK